MRIMLPSICAVLFLTSCTKFTDEDFFAAIRSNDAKKIQVISRQRDITKIKEPNAYDFDKATATLKVVPLDMNSSKAELEHGFSGLWVAVESNKPEIVKILLQHDFDLKEKHRVGDVTLTLGDLAGTGYCNSSLIKLLVQKGVAFDGDTLQSGPVLLTAAGMDKWNCVHALIDAGVNTGVTDSQGGGLLTSAVLSNKNIDIDYLITKIKDFNPLSSDSNYALIFAAQKGDVRLINNFIGRGFNACINHKGKYPRDFAIESKSIRAAELFPSEKDCQSYNDKAVNLQTNHNVALN